MPKKPRRRTPPIWLWVIWGLLFAPIVYLWFGDVGDEGLRNGFTIFLSLPIVGLGLLWFVFLSGNPGKTRAIVGLGALVLVVGSNVLFEYRGVSGAMIPQYGWRHGGGEQALAAVSATTEAPAVALGTMTPEDFPGFLGPYRNGAVTGVHLARDWTARPPELVWRQPIGAGWSGFAVVNGIAVTIEQRGDDEAVSAYDLATGELLWITSWPGHFEHFLGGEGPRSTPTIDGGRVFALGAFGRLVCLEGATGEELWARDLLADFDVTPEMEAANVQYGRSNSPLVLGDLVVVPAGGDVSTRRAGLVAVHRDTGEVLWEGPDRQLSFSSAAHATLAGTDQILIVNEDTVSGHATETGALLWEHPWPGVTSASASVSQAVALPPDRVLVSKGYGGGAMVLRLVPAADGLAVEEVWHNRRALRTKHTNAVLHDGHAYGLSDGVLECVALESGERVWRAGRYGHGQILMAGDLLLVLDEEGELFLVEPTPERPDHVLGSVQALEGKTWNNLALYGDQLVVRNGTEAAVWRLPMTEH